MKMDQEAKEPSPLQSVAQGLISNEKHKICHTPKEMKTDSGDVVVSPIPDFLRQNQMDRLQSNGKKANEDSKEIEYCSYSGNDEDDDIYDLEDQYLEDEETESFDDASSHDEDLVERAQRFRVLQRAASRQSISSEAFSLPLDSQGDVSSLECDTPDDNVPFDLDSSFTDNDKVLSNDSIHSMVLTKQSKLLQMYGMQSEDVSDKDVGESPVTEMRKRERRKSSSQRSVPRRFSAMHEPNTPTSTNNNKIRNMQALREVFGKKGKNNSSVPTRSSSDLGIKFHDHLVLEGDNESSGAEDGDNRGVSSRPGRLHRKKDKSYVSKNEQMGQGEEEEEAKDNLGQDHNHEENGGSSSLTNQSMPIPELPLSSGQDDGDTKSNGRGEESEIPKKSQDCTSSLEKKSSSIAPPPLLTPQISSSIRRGIRRSGSLPPFEHEGDWGENLPPELDLVEARKYIAQLAAGVPDSTTSKTPVPSLDISWRSDGGNDRRTHDGSGLSSAPRRLLRSLRRGSNHFSRRSNHRQSFASATSDYTEVIVDDDGEIFADDDEIVDYDGNGLNRNFISASGRRSILDDHSEYTEVVVDDFPPTTGVVGGNTSSHHRRRLRHQSPTYDYTEVVEYEIESAHVRGAVAIVDEEIVIEEEEEIIED